MQKNLFFFHGWSYDASFFTNIAHTLSGDNFHNIFFYDRGYYGAPLHPIISDKNDDNILICHSMGLFYALENYDLNNFSKIIALSSFSYFLNALSEDSLLKLHSDLDANPQRAIKGFSLLCGDKKRAIDITKLDVKMLQHDLEILMQKDITRDLMAHQHKIYVLHGDNDKVMPYSVSSIPSCEQIVIQNCAHIYSSDNQGEIIKVIKSWIME